MCAAISDSSNLINCIFNLLSLKRQTRARVSESIYQYCIVHLLLCGSELFIHLVEAIKNVFSEQLLKCKNSAFLCGIVNATRESSANANDSCVYFALLLLLLLNA